MVREQLKVLIQLATKDLEVAEKEARLIYIIGQANGIEKDEITSMLQKPSPIGELNTLSDDQKFEYLYNVVQLMKVDGQVFKSEIVFCEEIASKLGYKKGAVAELSARIFSDPTITADRDMLRNKVQKYLR